MHRRCDWKPASNPSIQPPSPANSGQQRAQISPSLGISLIRFSYRRILKLRNTLAFRRHHRASLPVTYVRQSFHSISLPIDRHGDDSVLRPEKLSCQTEIASESQRSDTAINLLPELVTGFESYSISPETNSPTRVDDHRIICRNATASIKIGEGQHFLVKLASMGKKSVSFISEERFVVGNSVSIATHYIEGAQNIYQDGRITRALGRSFDGGSGEYLVEFTRRT